MVSISALLFYYFYSGGTGKIIQYITDLLPISFVDLIKRVKDFNVEKINASSWLP